MSGYVYKGLDAPMLVLVMRKGDVCGELTSISADEEKERDFMTMIHTMDSSLERISSGYHHYFPCEFFLGSAFPKRMGV